MLVITYNSSQTIWDCLTSLTGQTFRDFEVILVDNGSKDPTARLVDSIKPHLNFPLTALYLEENLGFAGGNNLALNHISEDSRYIALLNPDARADSLWLQSLKKAMEDDAGVGICASKILTWDAKHIDSAGDIMLATFRGFKREADDPSLYERRENIFGACAGAAMYRKEMIEQIGFFDEDFFIQCEDTDLNFRAQLGGWKVLYEPEAVAFHEVGHSIGKVSDLVVYYSQRNTEFVRVKNVPASVLVTHLPQIVLGCIADFLYFGIRHMKWRPFIKAKIDALRMLPRMLKKRKDVMEKIKKVDDAYIKSLITPLFKDRRFLAIKLKRLSS